MDPRLFAVFVLAVPTSLAAQPKVPFGVECFSQTDHRGISNAEPIAELWNVGPFDCLHHCVVNAAKTGDGCAAVVYHKHFATCQLYNHDGNFNGAKVVFASGHEYYNRTDYEGVCADRIQPTRGYPQGQNRPKLLAHDQSPTIINEAALGDELTAIGAKASRRNQNTVQPQIPHHYLLANVPKTSGCPKGQRATFVALQSFTVDSSATPRAVLTNIDAEACLIYCTQNINKDGDPSPCALASYNRTSEHCALYDEAAKELGIFTRMEQRSSSDVVAVEKFCIDETRSCLPDSAFHVLFRRKIDGLVLGQVRSLDSLTECAALCAKTYTCQRATFRNGRCLLHTAPPMPSAYEKNKTVVDPIVEADAFSVVVEKGNTKPGLPVKHLAAYGFCNENGNTYGENVSVGNLINQNDQL